MTDTTSSPSALQPATALATAAQGRPRQSSRTCSSSAVTARASAPSRTRVLRIASLSASAPRAAPWPPRAAPRAGRAGPRGR
eukprot:536266-Lingulodinium_polyedra.AAC.1